MAAGRSPRCWRIGLIVVLITWAKVHPFLALILGGLTVGIVAGENINDVIDSFATGFGTRPPASAR